MNGIDSMDSLGIPPEHNVLKQSEERFRLLVEGVKDYAIFMLDPEGYITSWNEGAQRIKGYTAVEAIGRHFSMFYPKEKIDERWPEQELEYAIADGRFEDEGWRMRRDGTRFWANVIITALYDESHTLLGFSKITRDLTERRQNEERLRQSEERFRLLVESVKDYAIFMLNPEGYITSWNEGAQRIKGYSADEAIGRHFSMFYPQEKIDERWPEQELEYAIADGRFEDEGWRLRKDGTAFWANVIITPVYDSDGVLRGFAKVTRDMSEKKRIEALELAERRMTEFLAMLSHELRNPLAPIRNAVYLLQIKEVDDPELRWSRDVIDRQVTQLTRLVDDLLEISRMTSGNIRLQMEPVELGSIIHSAVEAAGPLIDTRKHRLELDLGRTPTMLTGDMTRLTQVFVNLLNNAAKYTPEGGTITLSAECRDDVVEVRVKDTGVGIAPDFLRKVFDLFTQGERTLDRSEGGLGIGLTLVRRLIEMHGGTVEALSKGLGHGSEFLVRLPYVPPVKREGDGGDDHETLPAEAPPLRVIVVDDNVDAAKSMQIFLKMWGFDARTAHDGMSAINLVKEHRPDVVLLDIGLPKVNGYDVAAQIRALPGGDAIGLIALTGYGQDEDRRRSREVGISHHLVKPVDPNKLREILLSMRK